MKHSRIISAVVTLILGFPILLPGSLEFTSVEEMNRHIESRWQKEGEWDSLYRIAIEGRNKYPSDGEILGRAAWLEMKLNKNDNGVTKIERALQLSTSAYVKIWATHIYINAGLKESDTERSVKLFRKAIAIDQAYAKSCEFWIGNRYLFSEEPDYEKAVRHFDLAEKAGSRDENLHVNRGISHAHLKRYSPAEKDFLQAQKNHPTNPSAYYYFASMRYEQKSFEDWAELLEKFLAFESHPFVKQQEINVRYNLALHYPLLGNFREAHKHLTVLTKRYPRDVRAEEWRESLDWFHKKDIHIQYEAAVSSDHVSASGIHILLPVQNSYQKILSVDYSPVPDKKEIIFVEGNTVARLHYSAVPERVAVHLRVSYAKKSLAENRFNYTGDMNWPQEYLSSNKAFHVTYDADDSNVRGLVSKIISAEKDPVNKARRIHDWMMQNFTYKVIVHSTLNEYLEKKTGECGGYAIVFTALCRFAGIPARTAFSPIFGYPDRNTFGSHATSEFYVKGSGWVPVNNTMNHFGFTSNVYTLWRDFSDPRKAAGIIRPDSKKILVRFQNAGGEWVQQKM